MLTISLLSGGDRWQVKCFCWAQSKHQLSGSPRFPHHPQLGKTAGCDDGDADLYVC